MKNTKIVELTELEGQAIRNCLVNSGQDKFFGSYPLMASLCKKLSEVFPAEQVILCGVELEQYGLSFEGDKDAVQK
jgi:hypothetical protein